MAVVESWIRDVELVTAAELAQLAPRGSLEAAQALLKSKVTDLAPSGEGVRARVKSGGTYTATVVGTHLPSVTWSCQCFMVSQRSPCVHVLAVVAMVDMARAAWGRLPRRPSAAPLRTTGRVEVGALNNEMGRVALTAWAEEQGIAPVLAERVSGHAEAIHKATAAWVVSDGPLWALALDAEPAGAEPTLRYLLGLAERRRAITPPPRSPPEDPGLRAVWDRVVSAQARTPTELIAPPLPAGPVVVGAHATECRATVVWPEGRCRLSGQTPRVALTLEASTASCLCGRDSGRCGVARLACDVLLDAISAGSPEAEQLSRQLATPRWRRVLDAAAKPDTGERRLAVDVTVAGEGVDATVTEARVVFAAPKRRGEGWAVTRAARAEVDAIVLLPGERAAAALLSGAGDEPSATISAIALLANQGLVLHEGQLWRVTRTRLSLKLAASESRLVAALMTPEGPGPSLEAWLSSPVVGSYIMADAERRLLTVSEASAALVAAGRLLLAMGEVPTDAIEPLLRHLGELGALADTDVDSSLVAARIEAEPEAVVRFQLLEGGLEVKLGFHHHADYPVFAPDEGPLELFVRGPDGPARVWRTPRDEARRAEEIREALGLTSLPGWAWRLPMDEGLDVVRRSEGLPARIEWSGRPAKVAAIDAPAVTVRAEGRGRWFRIGGQARVGEELVPLDLLLRALSERRRYVEVSPGTWVTLAERLRAPLQALSAMTQKDGLPDLAAPLVHELTSAGASADGVGALTQRLAAFEAAQTWEAPLPPELRATLRPYQLAGFRWLARLAEWAGGACLCDDMGLGKTLQALALLLHRAPRGPALVVAPMSLGFNWQREAAAFAPTLEVVAVRSRADLARLAPATGQLIVASYDLVAQNPEYFATPWATLVLDEAQAVKNAGTQRARAIHSLSSDFRVALTGTPVENRLEELWSIFAATVPGLFGSLDGFRERFTTAGADRTGLAGAIRPFLLRRLKRDVASDLPTRTDVRHDVELTEAERTRYELLRHAALQALERSKDSEEPSHRIQVLAALTRLRQAACHPRLIDPTSTERSAKLDALMELVHELKAEGHRALIFSQFARHLALVAEALDAAGITWRLIDGATSASSRRKEVDAFQAGHGDVFLISLKAGGTGLNLTAADYVIHLDPWWNPAIEDQATDRAHRIGQTRPVTVYRLVARSTVEDAIVGLHAEKRALVSELLADTGGASPLTTHELLELLRAASG